MEKPAGIKDKKALEYIEHLEKELTKIEHLEKELAKYTESPYRKSYITLRMVVDKINDDIVQAAASPDENDDKLKRLTARLSECLKQMVTVRNEMSPEERKKADAHPIGMAEQLALNEVSGKR